ncbi:MAG: type II secretion system F family protein [Bacteriovoracaceae bacterium]|nr:type II secretion system F family protein [Bacteriovoracaceae bacterium]
MEAFLGIIFEFISSTIILWLLLKFFVFTYTQHGYLYVADDKKKLLDIWVNLVMPLANMLRLTEYRKIIDEKLAILGHPNGWTSKQFVALQLIIVIAVFAFSYVFFVFLFSMPLYYVFIFTLFAPTLPLIKLQETSGIKSSSCNSELPYFIDFLSLTMASGLDFNQALHSAVTTSKKGPLSEEFKKVLRDSQLGVPRKDALLKMEKRMNVPSLRLFVHTLVQGIEMGTDMVSTLNSLSSILHTKKFQQAEERAGAASIKMMLPMMIFIMPAVMIVLLGPMVLQYVASQ